MWLRRERAARLDRLELVEPGVVQLSRWRPRTDAESQAAAALWGGVAVKRPY